MPWAGSVNEATYPLPSRTCYLALVDELLEYTIARVVEEGGQGE